MSRTIHALLVGIDEYPSPISSLSGCVNDVETFADYLRQRVDGANGSTLQLMMLRNKEATREAVIKGFREHLGKAGQGDVALFYYAGHGAQEQAPPEFWHLEPDRLDSTAQTADPVALARLRIRVVDLGVDWLVRAFGIRHCETSSLGSWALGKLSRRLWITVWTCR